MILPTFSIIVPCYNQGHFLAEVIDSVEKCPKELYELIIINDGSTDLNTLSIFKELELKAYKIIHQENLGLPAARNTGIKNSNGKYILPLDADNKIRPDYLILALDVLEANSNVSMVYGNPNYFGDKDGEIKVGEFNMQKLMINNYIDACAIIRKDVFGLIGYYNTNLKQGLEDWEFWLRMAFKGLIFFYINKVLFDYRVINNSMSNQLLNDYSIRNSAEKDIEIIYQDKLGKDHLTNYYIKRFKSNPFFFLIKILIMSYFPTLHKKLLNNNKIVRGL